MKNEKAIPYDDSVRKTREKNTKIATGTYVDIWEEYKINAKGVVVTFPEYMGEDEIINAGIPDKIKNWFFTCICPENPKSDTKMSSQDISKYISERMMEEEIDYSGIFVQEFGY